MSSEELNGCNKELDALIYDIFDTLNEIFSLRELLKVSLNQGYFHLAKARYSMGIKSVTSLQYNLTEDCIAKYKINVDETGLVDILDSLNLGDVSTEKENPSATELRSRHNKSDDVESKSKPNKSKNNDPLLWFGVLVPKPLRQSQQNFRSSIDLILQITKLQTHLVKMQEEYKTLQLKKKELRKS